MENKYMENTKRKDLVKYKSPTRVISFRCDASFDGGGLYARITLKNLFLNALKHIKENKDIFSFVEENKYEIEQVNKILAIDILKGDD